MDLGSTTWKNPTDKIVKVVIFVSPGQVAEYVIKPKGEASIPSQFDHAIHQLRDGIIVGGLAPQLVREGKPAELHPSLRPPSEDNKGKQAATGE